MSGARPRAVPTRTCVACRASNAKRELVRIVRTPDGKVLSDPSGRLAGRGAYLCADGSCWGTALEKGSLARALGVPLPEALRIELGDRARALVSTGLTVTTTNTTATKDDEGGQRGKK